MSEGDEGQQSSLGGAVGTIFVNLFGPWSRALGQRIGQGAERRNLENVAEKVAMIERDTPSVIDAEFVPSETLAITLVENAAKEEFGEVQELWARLIVAAKSGEIARDYKSYVDALRAFSPVMSILFEAICIQVAPDIEFPEYVGVMPNRAEAAIALGKFSDDEIYLGLASLKRLGIVMNIDRRFDRNRVHIPDVRGQSIKRGFLAISDAVDYLRMASEQPLKESIDRISTEGMTVIIVSVWVTDFGACLAKVLKIGASE